MMKIVLCTAITLLLVSARADDAEKVGAKCPVSTKWIQKHFNSKELVQQCSIGTICPGIPRKPPGFDAWHCLVLCRKEGYWKEL